jgi:hypothetical protein
MLYASPKSCNGNPHFFCPLSQSKCFILESDEEIAASVVILLFL